MFILKADLVDSCLIIQSPHLRVSRVAGVWASASAVSQSMSPIKMLALLLCWLAVTMSGVRGSEKTMTELKQDIFYHYDMNVIPQEVCEY